jgi:hypothetical protein
LGDDSHYQRIKAIPAAHDYAVTPDGKVEHIHPYFSWSYNPDTRGLQQVSSDFADLFHQLIQENTTNKRVILPLSGGLDSRSLAASLAGRNDIFGYSYEFKNGIPETWYSKQIADAMGFPFKKYEIGEPYLWENIDRLGSINRCTSEFTHPRQMAVIDELADKGDVFLLGHWGDVLFDDMGIHTRPGFDELVTLLYKKVLKKGGQELGRALWQAWGLSGSFDDYLKDRLSGLLKAIEIDEPNARIRAFKSLYWAPRWTSSNLSIFEQAKPMFIPYYHDAMCAFITTVDERILSGRQVQIEYLKKWAPALAKIKWQTWGMDLYSYKNYYHWSHFPARVLQKIKSSVKSKPLIQRNWEIQFLGDDNARQLDNSLLHDASFTQWIPKELSDSFLQLFREKDGVYYSHPVSILLTLSTFNRLRNQS